MGISVFPAAGGGVTQKVSTFTSTGTFTAPSNVSAVEIFLVAGGGGGGASTGGAGGGVQNSGGAGGGQVIKRIISVTPGTSYTVTVGGGGAGSTSGTATGSTGSDTTFGSLATAKGGGGGGSINYPTGVRTAPGRGGGMAGTAGGNAVAAGAGGGAGSNAFLTFPGQTANALSIDRTYVSNFTTSVGGLGSVAGTSTSGQQTAGVGIDGYGNGGGGGFRYFPTSNSAEVYSVQWAGTGNPGYLNIDNSTITNAANSVANTGDGGHGTIVNNTATTSNGSSGGSGFARVIYWS